MQEMHIGVNSDAYFGITDTYEESGEYLYDEDCRSDKTANKDENWDEGQDVFEEKTVSDEEIAAFKYETDPVKLREIFDKYHYGTHAEQENAAILIEKQLNGLILSIGHKHFPTYMKNKQECEELISSAWCGVFDAAPYYDPNRSLPSTFFYRPILHEMNEYIARFLNKSTSYSMSVRKKIKEATEKLAARGIKNPRVLDIAYESGLKSSAVRKAQESKYYATSRSLEDMVVDPSEYSQSGKSARAREDYDAKPTANPDFGNPFALLAQQEDISALYRALDSLPDGLRDILNRRFGLAGYDVQNYTTIFNETGISTDRVKAMEQQAMNRMRMNSDLRRNYRGGKANEIKEELNFEPVSITPDNAALTMMDLLDDIEESDF